MNTALRAGLRRASSTNCAAKISIIACTSPLRIPSIPSRAQPTSNRQKRHASLAATSRLVPKEHLRISVPDDCQVMQLDDGRLMSFAEYGSKRPDAHPVLFCHGIPDCRMDCCLLPSDKALAEKLNIRWIAIDRPGIGFSTLQPGRKTIDWANDARQLVEHLNLPSYYIFSVSGGTGFALAATKCLPHEQIKGVGICVGVAPVEAGTDGMSLVNRVGYYVYRRHPSVFRYIIGKYMVPDLQLEDPSRARATWRKQLKTFKGEDFKELSQPGMEEAITDLFREVYRQGEEGHIQDSITQTSDWGFELENVGYSGIRLWYGEKDVNTPPSMGKYMAARLPGSIYKEYKGKSHFTTWQHIEEILTELVDSSDKP